MSQIKSRSINLTAGLMMLLSLGSFTLLSMNSAHAMSQNEGGWVNKQYNIKGGWEILEKNGKSIIKFTDNFQTKGGPDLKIFLSKRDITSATGKNATSNSILLSALKSNSGAQEYVVPSNIDLNDYQSVLIHCESFSVLWGGANI